jgi:hypothetical protein
MLAPSIACPESGRQCDHPYCTEALETKGAQERCAARDHPERDDASGGRLERARACTIVQDAACRAK